MLRKGGAIMKGKIMTLVLLFLASLLFPYTMTIICFDTGLMSSKLICVPFFLVSHAILYTIFL